MCATHAVGRGEGILCQFYQYVAHVLDGELAAWLASHSPSECLLLRFWENAALPRESLEVNPLYCAEDPFQSWFSIGPIQLVLARSSMYGLLEFFYFQ